MKNTRYPGPNRLMLKLPSENLALILEVTSDAKAALRPVVCGSSLSRLRGRPALLNLHYLNILTVERALLSPAALLKALPVEKSYVYLTAPEFRSILALLKKRSDAEKNPEGKWRSLLGMLAVAEVQFNTLYGPEYE